MQALLLLLLLLLQLLVLAGLGPVSPSVLSGDAEGGRSEDGSPVLDRLCHPVTPTDSLALWLL